MFLANRLINHLTSQQQHLVVAESLTAGLLSATLANVPGASKVFQGSIVSYNNHVKINQLGVDESYIKKHGVVNDFVASQMAIGVKGKLAAPSHRLNTIAVATTGVAGPDDLDGISPGVVFIALAYADQVKSREYFFQGDRQQIREATTIAAIEMLWELVKPDFATSL